MKNLKEFNLSQYCITESGKLYSLRVNRFLTGWLGGGDDAQYRIHGVTTDSGEVKQIYIHTIVCEVFHGDRPEGYVANHKDGNKGNPHKDNLEWVSPSGNLVHAYDTGLTIGKLPHKQGVETFKGEYIEQSELSEEVVHQICQLIVQGYRDVDISRMLEVGRKNINKLRHKHTDYWFWVTKEYTFEFEKEERMSPEIVIKICELLEKDLKVMEISRIVNVNRKKVGNIKNRKTFTDISKSYEW